ncbi:MAG: hypothetical protein JSR85_08490 [Proteobacteria bacterium]|nr:hypothetical protein [Pseudomonadota bacterium]
MTTRQLTKNFLLALLFCAIFMNANHVKAQEKYFCCGQGSTYTSPFLGKYLPSRDNCSGCPAGNDLVECQSISQCVCVSPQETSSFNQNCIANSGMTNVPSKKK